MFHAGPDSSLFLSVFSPAKERELAKRKTIGISMHGDYPAEWTESWDAEDEETGTVSL